MPIKIYYKNKFSKKNLSNLVFFTDENFRVSNLKNYISKTENLFVSDLLKTKNLSKKIVTFDISSKKKIILVSLKKNLSSSDVENLGAKFYDLFKDFKTDHYNIYSDSVSGKLKNLVGHFLHGLKLKSYTFEKYKTKKTKKDISIIVTGKNIPSTKDQIKFKAIEEGTFFTRDLVCEPGNVLHPDEYARRLSFLRKEGLKFNI